MSTAKLIGGGRFVEGCLKSQINASICELDASTIGAISETMEVIMPQLVALMDNPFLTYKFVVFAHESAMLFCTLLELDYFHQYSVVAKLLQSATSVSICKTPLFQMFESSVVGKCESL